MTRKDRAEQLDSNLEKPKRDSRELPLELDTQTQLKLDED